MPAGVVDVGERALSPGATVRGRDPLRAAVARARRGGGGRPAGVSVRQAFQVYSSFDRVDLAGLWPGRWTVSARSGDEVLATGEVDVEGTGTYPLTLTAGQAPTP